MIHKCSTFICIQFCSKRSYICQHKGGQLCIQSGRLHNTTTLYVGGFSCWLQTINIAHILCQQCTKECYKLIDTSWAVNVRKSQLLSHKTTGLSVSTRAVFTTLACLMEIIALNECNPELCFFFTDLSCFGLLFMSKYHK